MAPGPAAEPRDAASLVLLRASAVEARSGGPGDGLEVLMGRRHRKSRFMPGVYVFPGGAVDRPDRRASGFNETMPPPPRDLDPVSQRDLVVFARTALRETYEETGLLVGAPRSKAAASEPGPSGPLWPGDGPPPDDLWSAYRAAGLEPAFAAMPLVTRATTPAYSPIRFHSRFFLARGVTLGGSLRGDGELQDLTWIPVQTVPSLPTAAVTRRVLRAALALLGRASEEAPRPGNFA